MSSSRPGRIPSSSATTPARWARWPCTRRNATARTRSTSSTDLARTMVLRSLASPLPITWVAADAAYGRDSRFRRFLEDAGLSYVVAVPKSQQVHGARIGRAFAEARQRLFCGDGAKGPR
ncbi:transposase [Streptomyces sp. NPDC047515]|uniref:transposase n=1 Tax=Streptomyces sp. NPDC047515 TaxID=3155380 RepID=UPI0033C34A7D